MNIFSSAKAKLAAQKLAEEYLYELAAEEISANNIRPGLWAKAIAEADGDEAKAKARCIKLRVEVMRAEADVSKFALQEMARAPEKAAKENADKDKRSGPTEEDSEEPFLLLAVCLAIFLFMLFFLAAALNA